MDQELQAIKRHQVYATQPEWVDPTTEEGKRKLDRTVGLRWQYDTDANGHKTATVTAEGNKQAKHTYKETSAPTLSMKLLRVIISYAVFAQYRLHEIEIAHAFKYAPVDTEMYVLPLPTDPVTSDKRVNQGLVPIYKLNKAISGLKQSQRLWWDLFLAFMASLGFVTSSEAPCVFVLHTSLTTKLVVGMFVDDLIVAANDQRSYDWFLTKLNLKFVANDLGQPNQYLGLDIIYNGKTIDINKSTYIKKLITKYSLDPNAGAKLKDPVPKTFDWSRFDDKDKLMANMSDEDIAEGKRFMNQRMGVLNDLANACRDDIAEVVKKLSQFQNYPHVLIQRLVQRVLLYVAQTPEKGIRYDREHLLPTLINCFSGKFAPSQVKRLHYTLFTTGHVLWNSREIKATDREIDVQFAVLFDALDDIFWLRKVWGLLTQATTEERRLTDDVGLLTDSMEMFDHIADNDYRHSSREVMAQFKRAQALLTLHRWLFGPVEVVPDPLEQ